MWGICQKGGTVAGGDRGQSGSGGVRVDMNQELNLS